LTAQVLNARHSASVLKTNCC